MKTLIFALSTLVAFSSTAFANGYHCKEINSNNEQQVEVVVTELGDVTNTIPWGKDYDSVSSVKVQVYVTNDGQFALIQEFQGLATTMDVIYTITSQRKNGFTFRKYLDEDDQDYLVLKNANSQETEHQISCQYIY